MSAIIEMSTLPKTWIFDLDGTIVKHNGYKIDGYDSLLNGAKEYLQSLPLEDKIIFVTSRMNKYRDSTIKFLNSNDIRYDEILFEMPMGERILVNDDKPSGLKTAYAFSIARDTFKLPNIIRNK